EGVLGGPQVEDPCPAEPEQQDPRPWPAQLAAHVTPPGGGQVAVPVVAQPQAQSRDRRRGVRGGDGRRGRGHVATSTTHAFTVVGCAATLLVARGRRKPHTHANVQNSSARMAMLRTTSTRVTAVMPRVPC